LIKEEQAIKQCLYCGAELDITKWKSRFHIRKHYKEHRCECGRQQLITVDIESSGHDSWIIKKVADLEEKVRK